MDCDKNFWDLFLWFVFDGTEAVRPCGYDFVRLWDSVVFSSLAALSFIAFVLIDLSAFLVRRYGIQDQARKGMAIVHGAGTLMVIVIGGIGAYIVALFVCIIDFLQINVQTSIGVGVTWQIVYAQMLERFTNMTQEPSAQPAPAAPLEALPEQLITEEEEE